ncbi:hypothetical protein [Streptomyces sp. NPDC049555]|uniref:hypothetical protein n=1 Tax=Streptomyces sp. NPDC049555 TaxID=3154930 RepID=UPI003436F382
MPILFPAAGGMPTNFGCLSTFHVPGVPSPGRVRPHHLGRPAFVRLAPTDRGVVDGITWTFVR